ncbi:unnamed protein product [Eruca vesicaria subsp. sativa]|uniref:Uncharacterized protein n=1 Tax=Eruca vesicaria subsp. sativa TaxID=29727 RepID=A0ABC8KIY2_ERUVS|nr:unnamed protein product [Eruca vesicaria subsp. sativa]
MYSLIFQGRSLEVQKWLPLRSALNLFQNASLFSSATAADVEDGRKGNNFTVSHLLTSLGLSTKLAESIISGNKGNPDSVLNLLRSHGFTDPQISTIITDYPRLLLLDAEKSLAPKLQFLKLKGASTSELTEILSKVPKILGEKGENTISRYYGFVKDIIEADKNLNSCQSLPHDKLRNIMVLRGLGVPQKLLFSRLISEGQPVCGKENFDIALNKVLEMGFDPTTLKFLRALQIFYDLRDHKQ